MQEKEAVNDILSHIERINWGYTESSVSLFETTIRYLGGMLAGYDLLNSETGRFLLAPGRVRKLPKNTANTDSCFTERQSAP
jgi:mannosyl-oligosaccharide alpha-1,2-mannosidase